MLNKQRKGPHRVSYFDTNALPSAPEAEEVILGSIIHNPKWYWKASEFISNDDVFHGGVTNLLWNKLTKMIRSEDPINLISVTSSLTDKERRSGLDAYYITGLTGASDGVRDISPYLKIIYDKYLLREVIHKTKEIQDSVYKDDKGTPYGTLAHTHSIIGELIQARPGEKFDINKEISTTIDSIVNQERNLIDVGYPCVHRFCGGLTRGEITIVGGRPGHGKTTFLLNLVSNIIHSGKKVMLFNREMSNTEMLKKILVLESQNLSYRLIRQGVVDGPVILEEIERTKQKVLKAYNEEKFLMFDNIRNMGRAATEIKKFNPDVIVDDYVQLIEPDSNIEQRRLQIEKIVNDYKWIAKAENCACILASQLNRGLETRGDARPRLSDLAESGAMEQIAENVFFVYYDWKINKGRGKNAKTFNDIEIIASKVRYGTGGSQLLFFDGDKVKMIEEELTNGLYGN